MRLLTTNIRWGKLSPDSSRRFASLSPPHLLRGKPLKNPSNTRSARSAFKMKEMLPISLKLTLVQVGVPHPLRKPPSNARFARGVGKRLHYYHVWLHYYHELRERFVFLLWTRKFFGELLLGFLSLWSTSLPATAAAPSLRVTRLRAVFLPALRFFWRGDEW